MTNGEKFPKRVENTVGKGDKPLPNKPLFLPVCGIDLLETLWENEKLFKI